MVGIGLSALSLFLDGFIATSQEALIHEYEPNSNELMFSISLWQLLAGGLGALHLLFHMFHLAPYLWHIITSHVGDGRGGCGTAVRGASSARPVGSAARVLVLGHGADLHLPHH